MTRRYWWVLITYVITQVSVVIIAPILLRLTSLNKIEAGIYGNIVAFIIGFFVILFILKSEMKENLRNTTDSKQVALWSFLGVVMAYIAQAIAVSIEVKVFGIKTASENTALLMEITREIPLFIVVTTLIAPVLEEIIFRKIIFGSLYKRTNFFIAGTLSALIFGFIHGEPKHILIYASMGFVFAYLYVKTNRIIVPIIVHMALNTITVIAQYSLTPEEIQKRLEQLHIFIGG